MARRAASAGPSPVELLRARRRLLLERAGEPFTEPLLEKPIDERGKPLSRAEALLMARRGRKAAESTAE